MLGSGLAQQPILLGVWFGLLHALDADHISTLGALAVNNRSRSAAAHAIRWASGHAIALTGIGLLVIGLGLWGLTVVSRYAEIIVAVTLLAIGAHALRLARRGLRRGTGTRGAHIGASPEAAGAALARQRTGAFEPSHHASWLMGLLHGGAGSAAVLALLPLAAYGSVAESAAYLASFSLGVAAGAFGFACVFARCAARTWRAGARVSAAFRAAVGLAAVAAGLLLLWEQYGGGA